MAGRCSRRGGSRAPGGGDRGAHPRPVGGGARSGRVGGVAPVDPGRLHRAGHRRSRTGGRVRRRRLVAGRAPEGGYRNAPRGCCGRRRRARRGHDREPTGAARRRRLHPSCGGRGDGRRVHGWSAGALRCLRLRPRRVRHTAGARARGEHCGGARLPAGALRHGPSRDRRVRHRSGARARERRVAPAGDGREGVRLPREASVRRRACLLRPAIRARQRFVDRNAADRVRRRSPARPGEQGRTGSRPRPTLPDRRYGHDGPAPGGSGRHARGSGRGGRPPRGPGRRLDNRVGVGRSTRNHSVRGRLRHRGAGAEAVHGGVLEQLLAAAAAAAGSRSWALSPGVWWPRRTERSDSRRSGCVADPILTRMCGASWSPKSCTSSRATTAARSASWRADPGSRSSSLTA